MSAPGVAETRSDPDTTGDRASFGTAARDWRDDAGVGDPLPQCPPSGTGTVVRTRGPMAKRDPMSGGLLSGGDRDASATITTPGGCCPPLLTEFWERCCLSGRGHHVSAQSRPGNALSILPIRPEIGPSTARPLAIVGTRTIDRRTGVVTGVEFPCTPAFKRRESLLRTSRSTKGAAEHCAT